MIYNSKEYNFIMGRLCSGYKVLSIQKKLFLKEKFCKRTFLTEVEW